MKSSKILPPLVLAVLVCSGSFAAICDDCFAAIENWQPSPWVKTEPYVEKSINKLGFGLLNAFTGWTALFFEPSRYENKFTGVAKGIWRTVTNTAGGIIHTVTFPLPIDFPLPDGGIHFE